MSEELQLRKITVHRGDRNDVVRMHDLKKGDIFTMEESDGTSAGTWEATGSPYLDPKHPGLMAIDAKNIKKGLV